MKVVIALFMVIFIGCNGCSEKKKTTGQTLEEIQKGMIESNKIKHQDETKRIHEYIKDKKWPMTETRTGLNYWVYEKGTGAQAKEGEVAVLSYSVELFDGTICYTKSIENPGRFLIGQDNVESGLHEAVQLLHAGDKARLILPSHLAFGFTGDFDKIPQDASLVYDVQLIAIE